jgi:hypothetical protein
MHEHERQCASCTFILLGKQQPILCVTAQAGLSKQENGRKVARSGSLQRVPSAEHPAKKGCHGRSNHIKPEVDGL